IRAGNTLVGFTSLDEVKNTMDGNWIKLAELPKIHEEAEIVDRAFNEFHKMQTEHGMNAKDFAKAKKALRNRLRKLEEELNHYLAQVYNVDSDKGKEFQKWRRSHQPFHWFAEFYGIMHKGGFNVIIGNPPYLNLSSLREYTLIGFATLPTRNLYPIVMERCQLMISRSGRQGYIVPVSSISTEGYSPLQMILSGMTTFASSFDDRPAHLFEGLDKNTLSILLLSFPKPALHSEVFTTRLQRWNADERQSLFSLLDYEPAVDCQLHGCVPKIGSKIETSIWTKLLINKKKLALHYSRSDKYVTYYSRKVNAFLQVLDFVPKVRDGSGNLRPPSEFKTIKLRGQDEAAVAFCTFNSTLFRWFIDIVTDGSHINRREIDNFSFDPSELIESCPKLGFLAKALNAKLKVTSEKRVMRYKHDTLTVQCIIPKYSKSIIDEIDKSLAEYYRFADEELDFLINYDIKYR
ncbi:SAM-dependent methyltransferase, partial [bacterium]|nr:SAM-dependent methyltransferase [bacterium]